MPSPFARPVNAPEAPASHPEPAQATVPTAPATASGPSKSVPSDRSTSGVMRTDGPPEGWSPSDQPPVPEADRPTADPAGYGTPRTLAEFIADLGNGVLGLVSIAAYGALQALWPLVISLNDDEPSKPTFVVVALILVVLACGATTVLARRAQEGREQGLPLEVVHALSLGAGVLVSTYGVLVVLTALISNDAQALGTLR